MTSRFRSFSKQGVLALAFWMMCSPHLHACTVCMGDPNSREAGAMNAAIFLMLAFIGGVLVLLTAFGFHLYRKSGVPMEPHLAFAAGVNLNEHGEKE